MKPLLGFITGILLGVTLYILWVWEPRPSDAENLLYEQCAERGGLPQFSAWGHTVGCVGFRHAK